jgi:hypothetical protein
MRFFDQSGGWDAMFRSIMTCIALSLVALPATAGDVPAVVREYASTFVKSHAQEQQLSGERTVADDYALWFFQGYTHPQGGAFTASDIRSEAYKTGQAYWNAHPSERAAIFAGFGYQAVEREGIWSRGFEMSAFQPDDAEKAAWWMTTLGGVAWQDVGLVQSGPTARQMRVHIVGYVSPAGRYGHLGAYAREVLVTSALRVDAGSR